MNSQPKPQCDLLACTRGCKRVCWYAQIQHGHKEHYRIHRERAADAKKPATGIPKGWGFTR